MFAMSMPDEGDRLLTIKEIEREWGLSYHTIQRTLQTGVVPNTLKYSNRGGYRVRRRDWETYARARWGLKVQQALEQKSE